MMVARDASHVDVVRDASPDQSPAMKQNTRAAIRQPSFVSVLVAAVRDQDRFTGMRTYVNSLPVRITPGLFDAFISKTTSFWSMTFSASER